MKMKHQSAIAKMVIIGAITLFSASAFAMGPMEESDHHECGCMQKHEGHDGMMKNHNKFPMILKKKLGLTGKQAGEISDIMKEERQNTKPLFEAVHKERKTLMDTAKAGDQLAVKAQAGKLADAEAALAMHRAACHKRFAAVMTKEQAEKFEKISAEFGNHKGKEAMKSCDKEHGKGAEHKHMEHMNVEK